MSHLSVDPCEVAVERRRVERGHSTEGAVDGRSDGLTGQGADPVPYQGADRGLNDAVDVLHYKPLELKSSMSLHDTYIFVFCFASTGTKSMNKIPKYVYMSLHVLSWKTN